MNVQYIALLLCIFKDYMYLHTKVSYKAQLYVIMYNLCYIKAINSDNVGVMLHNFTILVLFFIKLVYSLVWFYT